MSGTDELIAAGLRDLAGEATGFRPAAGELWQAGQRRRHRGVLAVSAAAAAGAITTGQAEITGFASRAQAQALLRALLAR